MIKRTYNFSAGPASLPVEVLEEVQEELLDWQGYGFSVIESSHRNPDYVAMANEAEQDLRDLMAIPDNYRVLFSSGGASFQFASVPLNLAGKNRLVDYFHTGHWSAKAIAEARRYCDVNVVTSNSSTGFIDIPDKASWVLSDKAAYACYTPNETVHGLAFPFVPETGSVPLVADMTSSLLQEAVDVSRFGLIYAGVQKNIAPAGMTIVIVRDDLLDQAMDVCPSLLKYSVLSERDSMPNTPPTFSWYVAGRTFKWLKRQGGVAEMMRRGRIKVKKIYDVIDASDFYKNEVKSLYRSMINVPFSVHDTSLNPRFLEEAEKADIRQISGHATKGGMRASVYNAVTDEAVDVLVAFMQAFEKKYG